MFGSEMLEVAVGVIFLFLLVSVICTAVREGIDGWLKTRAAFLEHGIRELLNDKHAVGLARTFYTHPLIYGLFAGNYEPRPSESRPSALASGDNLPSYIPSRNFALALLDIAARGPESHVSASDSSSPVLSLSAVRSNVLNIENAAVQRVLLTAVDTAQGDLDKAVANVAAWYDSGMDRVSGAYKRSTQKLLFYIGLALAVGLNINVIMIADYLYHNDAARAAVVARAEAVARDSAFVRGDPTNKYAEARAALDSIRIPIGWEGVHFGFSQMHVRSQRDRFGFNHLVVDGPSAWNYVVVPIVGWLITAFAATLGAAFWFDILNKVMVIRSTVKPHEKSPEESSEDRQTGPDRAKVAASDVGSEAHPVGTAQSPGATPGKTPGPITPPPRDPEDDVDGCDVEGAAAGMTSDDSLPAARGGVE
jgi:hypothetical protein